MKRDTIRRKIATKGFRQISEDEWLRNQMYGILAAGKQAFDRTMLDLGRMLAESIMYMEREEISGPDHAPRSPSIRKWASEQGSVFIGDQKVKVQRPRIRDCAQGSEIGLKSYAQMQNQGQFSDELMEKVLSGLSARRYGETVVETAQAFGVSPSSISRKVVEASATLLQQFKERGLSDFNPFAIFLDTIHRGGRAFTVSVGVGMDGQKMALGFFEGATENHEVCDGMLADLEDRGLRLHKRVIFITDGGKGIIKSLKERFGKHLIHQRCTIHKDRNIQAHLPKRYRKVAHKKYRIALEQTSYGDAKKMLLEFERWLRNLNESSADSLLEALEEILTLHRLKVSADLRRSLHSTNIIESMFSSVRHCEKNLKRYKCSNMAQRWLASALLHCEKGFKRVKGFRDIAHAVGNIEREQENQNLAACEIELPMAA